MIYDWYNLFSMPEFLASGLVSKVYKVTLDGVGQKDILVVRGSLVSIVYEDVLLPVSFEGDNPFDQEGDASHYAVYQDVNEDVWIGIEQAT
jgi:hypothetical protein